MTRTSFLALLAWAALIPAASAADGIYQRQDAISDGFGKEAFDALRPAYGLVEGISDSLFDFVRYDLLNPVFHGIKDQVHHYRQTDSYASFEQTFSQKESRFLLRLSDTFHRPEGATVNSGLPATGNDRSWAGNEQMSVFLDSFKDTLLERYQLEQLGVWAQKYAKDPSNWDPASITMASMVGGAFLYLNGAHDQHKFGPLKVAFDLRGAVHLREAMKAGGSLGRAAGIEIGMRDQPLTFGLDWGVDSGKIHRETYGLKYHAKF